MDHEADAGLIRAADAGHVQRWALPSFDPPEPEVVPEPEEDIPLLETQVEDVEPEALQPLTLEELEAIRQEAHNEGFATGEREGYHAGMLKAQREVDGRLAEQVKRLEQVMTHLLEPIAEQDDTLEQALVELLSVAARQVIQRELQLDSSQVVQVLREALKLLPLGAGNIRIFVNPQDFEVIKQLRERHEEQWRIVEDDSLLPGGCRVESQHSLIDASRETRMQQVLAQLSEQALQQRQNPVEPDIHEDC